MRNHNNNGAGSAAPNNSTSGAPSRPSIPFNRRNFHTVFGGSSCNMPRPPARSHDICPTGALCNARRDCEVLNEASFANGARQRRCGLCFDLLRVVVDEVWDVRRATLVLRGEKGAHRAMLRLFENSYQVPPTVPCDRAFVDDPFIVEFMIRTFDRSCYSKPIRSAFVLWRERLPNYCPGGSASVTRFRKRDGFEWALLSEGALVVTQDGWEVTRGISSRQTLECMSVSEVMDRGFHLDAKSILPRVPPCFCAVSGIPAGLAIPLLWSLRFFAATLLGSGTPDGFYRPSSSARQRLLEVIDDELVICLVLRVTAEREAFKRTPYLPAETIDRLFAYDEPDIVPIRQGDISIGAIGAHLRLARTVPIYKLVEERPLHVTNDLLYAPDETLDELALAEAVVEPVIPMPESVTEEVTPLKPSASDAGVASAPSQEIEPARASHAPQASNPSLDSSQVRETALGPSAPVELCSAPLPSVPSAPVVAQPVLEDHASHDKARSGPLDELITTRVNVSEFLGSYSHLRLTLAPLGREKGSSLREILEYVSGWVRRADPQFRKAQSRGTRGGAAVDLHRARGDLASVREENHRLRREMGAMTDRLSRLSERVGERAGSFAAERRRDDCEGARDRARHEDVGRSYRLKRGRSPREEWDVSREPPHWPRRSPEGDGGSGFAA